MFFDKEIIHDMKQKKQYKRDIRRPSFLGEENKVDQRSFIFYKFSFSLLICFDENNIAEISL